MTKKAFILWGLGLVHLFMLTVFVSAFWNFSKHPATTDKPELMLSGAFLIFTTTFLFLCWKQVKATERRPITLLWVIILLIASLPIATGLSLIYTDLVLYGDMFMKMIKAGTLLETPNKTLFIAASIPIVYMMFWGFFAALFILARDPKAPSSLNWLRRFKRTPKITPLQADPVLVNGTWLTAR